MDSKRFDAFARRLGVAMSRRDFARVGSGALGGVVVAPLGFSAGNVLAAKSGKCKKPCGVCERCDRGKCTKKNGKKHCKRGTCKPKPDGTPCCPQNCIGGCQNGACGECIC